MRKTLLLGTLKLVSGFGGLLVAFYCASDMVAHEIISIPPITPPPAIEVLLTVLLTAAEWGGVLLLAYLMASGFNSLSQYGEERWRESLDYGRPEGH